VAAASNDTAPVLITLGASVEIAGPAGLRTLPLSELYTPDGIVNTRLSPEELVVEVRVPAPAPRLKMGYQKVRVRASIDYPALTVALAVETNAQEEIQSLRMVVSALGARPHAVARLEALHGRVLDRALIDEVGRMAHKQCHPLTNINVDPGWRREMIPVFVRRAFEQARGPELAS
jgi:4-hydroxybenzoyl-CoA reductase subunit beta